MNLMTYARRNMFRRKGRTIMTIVAVALGVLIFSAIRTAVASWNLAKDQSVQSRLYSRHKSSITFQLPKRYIDDVRGLPGIKSATWGVWFAGKDPKERTTFFATLAVDPESWFNVMDEMVVDPKVIAEWKATPNGVIMGEAIARTLEVKPGMDLKLNSDVYGGTWDFKVVGIYKTTRATADRNTVVFHWSYLNNDERNVLSKEQIGWVISNTADAKQSAAVARAIDSMFEQRDDKTVTMDEKAFQASFLGAFGTMLVGLDVFSLIIMLILALILANAIAMSVRERTHEYGVLRAIGFSPKYVVGFIVGESILIALLGGVIGAVITQLFINGVMGPAIEANMSAIFAYYRTPPSVLIFAVVAAAVIGAVAGAIPSVRAARLKVTDALRRLD